LNEPPIAKSRLSEINHLLFQYLSLILGRMDMIQNNNSGSHLLETIVYQIILLLREILFIGKSATRFLKLSDYTLDSSLENLLVLVTDLVSTVKKLLLKTSLNQTTPLFRLYSPNLISDIPGNRSSSYFYTLEGIKLIAVVSKMIKSVSSSLKSCRYLLDLIPNGYTLDSNRKHPDFQKMKISPKEFVQKCSINSLEDSNQTITPVNSNLNKNAQPITLLETLAEFNSSSPYMVRISAFARYKDSSNQQDVELKTNPFSVDNEILLDGNGKILGATFRALVYLLVNELHRPDRFFFSTFFLTFRIFSTPADLIEELIKRFDADNKEKSILIDELTTQSESEEYEINSEQKYTVFDSRIKNRRKLILNAFKTWLESYWNYKVDYPLLPTIINFLNESAIRYLPTEVYPILEVAGKLAANHPFQDVNFAYMSGMNDNQLVTRRIGQIDKSSYEDGYHYYTTSTTALPADLSSPTSETEFLFKNKQNNNNGIGSSSLKISNWIASTSHISSLLNRNQLSSIEKAIMQFRVAFGKTWNPDFIKTSSSISSNPIPYYPIDIKQLLDSWYNICEIKKLEVSLNSKNISLLNFNCMELSKQLTIIESKIFVSIKPDELLNKNFITKNLYLKKSVNVEKSILFTNLLSEYVIETILKPGIAIKLRISNLKYWIKVAYCCLILRNFNSLAAIMTILQSSAISRLHRLWGKLNSKYYEVYSYLSSIIQPDKNFYIYRSKLKKYLDISKDQQVSNIPLVPYINLFLQDIIFVNEGNSDYRQISGYLKLINFDKHFKIVKILSDMEHFQVDYSSTYNIINTNGSNNLGTNQNLDDNITMDSVSQLQELILIELMNVHSLYMKDSDRMWNLSFNIQTQHSHS
ncbi:Ras-GEF domain-containing protein, partial [Ascoidea rubescens DSM 1968]